jgi:hypothetical protein
MRKTFKKAGRAAQLCNLAASSQAFEVLETSKVWEAMNDPIRSILVLRTDRCDSL